MRVTCPACHAEMSLDALVAREADARAMADFIARNVPLGAVLVRYLGLFRPAKRRLSLARTVALFDELLPDLQRGAISRKGRDWATPLELWRAALEQVLASADKGGLTLPLSGHGYLYEVLAGHADKAEAVAERVTEAERRGRGAAPAAAGPVEVAGVLAACAAAPVPPAPLPYDPAKGPSRAARELKARIEAARQARAVQPGGDEA